MGNRQTRSYKPSTIKIQSWQAQPVPNRLCKPQYGRFRLLRNKLTSEELEEYLGEYEAAQEFDRYLDFFSWREREDCIVNSKYLNYDLNREMCSANYRARIYLQHIPVRMSDIRDIPVPENLYLLLAALEGFEKLFQIAGSFEVTQDLICMDRDGKVKVWLNSDLSKCWPVYRASQDPESENRSAADQHRMVQEILRLVEENSTEEQTETEDRPPITDYIRRNLKGVLTFKLSKRQIIDYANERNIEIPNYFQSVIGLFDELNEDENPDSSAHPHNYKELSEGYQINEGSTSKVLGNYNPNRSLYRVPSNEGFQGLGREMRPLSGLTPFGNMWQNEKGNQFFSTYHPQIEQRKIEILDNSRPQSPITGLSSGNYQNSINKTNYKVSFNYGNLQTHTLSPNITRNPLQNNTKIVSQHIHTLSFGQQYPTSSPIPVQQQAQVPLQAIPSTCGQKLSTSSSLKDLLTNNRLIYSDCSTNYELDPEITADMLKFLHF